MQDAHQENETAQPRVLSDAIERLLDLVQSQDPAARVTKEQRLVVEETCCNLLATGFLSAHSIYEGKQTFDPNSILVIDTALVGSMLSGFRKGALTGPTQKRLKDGCESGGLERGGGWSCKCGARMADGPAWLQHAELPR